MVIHGLVFLSIITTQTPESAVWRGSAEPCRSVPGAREYRDLPRASLAVRRLALICGWKAHHAGLMNEAYGGAFDSLRNRAQEAKGIAARGVALTLHDDFILPELLHALLDLEKAGAVTTRVCETAEARAARNRRTAFREFTPVLMAPTCGVAEVLLPEGMFDDVKARRELARSFEEGRPYLKTWPARHQRVLYVAINEKDPWGAELIALQAALSKDGEPPLLAVRR